MCERDKTKTDDDDVNIHEHEDQDDDDVERDVDVERGWVLGPLFTRSLKVEFPLGTNGDGTKYKQKFWSA